MTKRKTTTPRKKSSSRSKTNRTKGSTSTTSKKIEAQDVTIGVKILAGLYGLLGLIRIIVMIFSEGGIRSTQSLGERLSRIFGILIGCIMIYVAWGLLHTQGRARWTAAILIALSLILSIIFMVIFMSFAPLLFIVIDGLCMRALWTNKEKFGIDM